MELVWSGASDFGECPLWDPRSGELLWADIPGGVVHRLDPDGGEHVAVGGFDAPSVLAVHPRGWLVATGRGIELLRRDDDAADAELLATAAGDAGSHRFNDGSCDPAGRLLVASMLRDASAAGTLHRWAGGAAPLESLLTGLRVPNGFAWDAAGERLFFTDSFTRRIEVCTYDAAGAALGAREPWCTIPEAWGVPDGMATDEEGGLWVAFWGGGAVRRLADGRLDEVLAVPVGTVTSCAFGGAGQTTLFVTTARQDGADELGGAVFAVDVGVRGAPVHAFAAAGA